MVVLVGIRSWCLLAFGLAAALRAPARSLRSQSRGLGAKAAAKRPAGFGAAPKQRVKTLQPGEGEAIAKCVTAVRRAPDDAKAWLTLGAVLNRAGEYAEAERVFARAVDRVGAGKNEMLDAALLTLRGHSAVYHRGDSAADAENAAARPDEEEAAAGTFEEFEVGGADVSRIESHRTVVWAEPPRAFASRGAILPPDECAAAIDMAERRAAELGGWLSARHAQAATTDLAVKDVPELLAWFNVRLEDTLFPMLQRRFPDKIARASQIRVHDAFIVKYDADAQRALATHVDESAFSFTIALNDRSDYEGGGTRFESSRKRDDDDDDRPEWAPRVLNADAGGVVCFPGRVRHGGHAITKGTRYIIPLFCFLDENKSKKTPGYLTDTLGV